MTMNDNDFYQGNFPIYKRLKVPFIKIEMICLFKPTKFEVNGLNLK